METAADEECENGKGIGGIEVNCDDRKNPRARLHHFSEQSVVHAFAWSRTGGIAGENVCGFLPLAPRFAGVRRPVPEEFPAVC